MLSDATGAQMTIWELISSKENAALVFPHALGAGVYNSTSVNNRFKKLRLLGVLVIT